MGSLPHLSPFIHEDSFSHPPRVRQIVIQLVSHSWERMGDFSASVNTEDEFLHVCYRDI